ncbi:STAG domain-containing protein [Lipomyces oligophaga]|uniref:STAG domain-containing protein n=1 Tax=Lipomyces oligophaga TaxID=45792 RepID=UPI0034CEFA52
MPSLLLKMSETRQETRRSLRSRRAVRYVSSDETGSENEAASDTNESVSEADSTNNNEYMEHRLTLRDPAQSRRSLKKRRQSRESDINNDESGDNTERVHENDDVDEDIQTISSTKRRGRPRKSTITVVPGRNKNSRRKRVRANSESTDTNVAAVDNDIYEAVKDSNVAISSMAIDWVQNYEEDNTQALMQLINFILRCSGCHESVTSYDIEDQDSVASTISQIQEVFGRSTVEDYPLTSKKPEFRKFRLNLTKFFKELIVKSGDRELLYKDKALMEQLEVWVGVMSSSALRSLRHTSTIIGLCILTSLSEIASSIAATIGSTTKMLEREKQKRRQASDAINRLQGTVDSYAEHAQVIDDYIRDLFQTIFVHRYQDIDPKIRTECIKELGTWMVTLPDTFFEGSYLRYMGWMLSDSHAATRHEVIRALTRLYKDNYFIGGLRQFTERFRTRLTEIATHDVDGFVRVSAIELLGCIRDIGFLEQEDVDEVCGLLFDTNHRVRKAVVKLFLSVIEDKVSETLENIGSMEVRDYFAGNVDETEHNNLEHEVEKSEIRKSWFALKSIANALEQYNEQENVGNPLKTVSWESILGGTTESRISIAACALWEVSNELPKWDDVLEYALADHSVSESDSEFIGTRLRKALTLTAQEEHVILDVAIGAIASLDVASDRPSKSVPKSVRTSDHQENIHKVSEVLIPLLPQLLKKYAADPDTSCSILRLGNAMNLNGFQLLRLNKSYETIFDRFCLIYKNFNQMSIRREFVRSVVLGQKNEYLSEVVEIKTRDLLDDLSNDLRQEFAQYDDILMADIGEGSLIRVSVLATKLMYLAPAIRINEALKYTAGIEKSLLEFFKILLSRAAFADEDELALMVAVITLVRYYVMWEAQNLLTANLVDGQEKFSLDVEEILNSLSIILTSSVGHDVQHATVIALIDILLMVRVLETKLNRDFCSAGTSVTMQTQNAIMRCFRAEELQLGTILETPLADYSSFKKFSSEITEKSRNEGELVEDIDQDWDEEISQAANMQHLLLEETEEDQDSVTTKEVRKIASEFVLCELAGKILLASQSGILSKRCGHRLQLNSKLLGTAYQSVVKQAPVGPKKSDL